MRWPVSHAPQSVGRAAVWAACLVGVLGVADSARAQGIYFTRDSVLRDMFSGSQRVDYVLLETPQVVARLTELLGYVPARQRYTVFVGWTDGKVDGYAVVDEQQGQHLPITFAVQLDAEGTVVRTEVMAYREAYGHEIRQQRFRDQFRHKRGSDPIRVGSDIQAITGATISSRSMAVGVRRSVALVRVLRESQATATPSRRDAPRSATMAAGAAD